MLDELGGVGFIASLLVEQDAAHAMHEARLEASLGLSKGVGTDDDAWCGDEDGPERHAEALVHLAASTCAAASALLMGTPWERAVAAKKFSGPPAARRPSKRTRQLLKSSLTSRKAPSSASRGSHVSQSASYRLRCSG